MVFGHVNIVKGTTAQPPIPMVHWFCVYINNYQAAIVTLLIVPLMWPYMQIVYNIIQPCNTKRHNRLQMNPIRHLHYRTPLIACYGNLYMSYILLVQNADIIAHCILLLKCEKELVINNNKGAESRRSSLITMFS